MTENKSINFLIDHVFQFVLTMTVLVFYFLTFNRGNASLVLENVLVLVVAYWFNAYTTLKTTASINEKVDSTNVKIQSLADKVGSISSSSTSSSVSNSEPTQNRPSTSEQVKKDISRF